MITRDVYGFGKSSQHVCPNSCVILYNITLWRRHYIVRMVCARKRSAGGEWETQILLFIIVVYHRMFNIIVCILIYGYRRTHPTRAGKYYKILLYTSKTLLLLFLFHFFRTTLAICRRRIRTKRCVKRLSQNYTAITFSIGAYYTLQ